MNKVFAIADLHGQYNLFEMVKEFLDQQGEDVKCYVLGDCVDRGPHGFKILQEVIEDPRFTLIRGNHEEMFLESLRENRLSHLHGYNGGSPTFNEWARESGETHKWIGILQDLPYCITYINHNRQRVILTHSGYTPKVGEAMECEDRYIWNRSHFNDKWDETTDENFKKTFIIHGHTPIPLMEDYCTEMYRELCGAAPGPGAYFYRKDEDGVGHKINIDCGGFFTGVFTILNLDTFEQHVFFDKNNIYKN